MGKPNRSNSPAAKTGADPRGGITPRADGSSDSTSSDSSSGGDTEFQPRRRAKKEEQVTVQVPRPFKFTADDGALHEYPSGIYEMPRSHAEHWYSQAHDVEIK